MRMSALDALLASLIAWPAVVIAYDMDRGVDPESACSVLDTADSNALVLCDDGKRVTVRASDLGTDALDGTDCTVADLGSGAVNVECVDGTSALVCNSPTAEDFRTQCRRSGDQVLLASGLKAEYATRDIANSASQSAFWPYTGSPTHLVFCVESPRAELPDGRLQPSVQSLELRSGHIQTVLRGMRRCLGLRSTPWGTLIALEHPAEGGGLYEAVFDAASAEEYSIGEGSGEGGTVPIVDSRGEEATHVVAQRIANGSVIWQNVVVLSNGTLFGSGELRPSQRERDGGGAGIFKFLPEKPRVSAGAIASLSDSPLAAGSVHALRLSYQSRPREDRRAPWPRGVEVDPHFTGRGTRFCFVNGNAASNSYFGSVECAVDAAPGSAKPCKTAVEVERVLEGDAELMPGTIAFHPTVAGLLYVVADKRSDGIWACSLHGAHGTESKSCVKLAALVDKSAEPAGFIVAPDGLSAYVSLQHSADGNMPIVEEYPTDDVLRIGGAALAARPFSVSIAERERH